MKKTFSQNFNEKYESIGKNMGDPLLGKKKKRKFSLLENGNNMNLKNEREKLMKEIDTYKKLEEKNEKSEKGYKIIMTDAQNEDDNEKVSESSGKVIKLKKKKRELKICKKKKSKGESDNISSELEMEPEIVTENKTNNKNDKNDKNSQKVFEESLPERTDTVDDANLSIKNTEKLNRDKIFSQDFIKIQKEKFTQVDKPELETNTKDENFSKIESGNFYPWLSKQAKRQRGMQKLHQEILDFYEFLKPSEAEDKLRRKTVKIVKTLIQTEWPTWVVKEFGSFPSKIHLPDSDVDILILTGKDSSADQHKILKKITKILVDANCVSYIQLIKARVPIIKATLKETKINLDIR